MYMSLQSERIEIIMVYLVCVPYCSGSKKVFADYLFDEFYFGDYSLESTCSIRSHPPKLDLAGFNFDGLKRQFAQI